MIPHRFHIGKLLFFLLILTALSSRANAEQSSLLGLAQDLHCASSEQHAAELLKKLSELPIKPFGIPSENFTSQEKVELYAATVDILLQVLYETIQHYPALQERIERTALLWNYCEIINDGDLADLHFSSQNEIIKSEAIGPFPANKQGFGIWGLLGRRFKNRYLPELLKSPSMYSTELQNLIHRLQNQCFSHPDFNAWPNKSDNMAYAGALHLTEILEQGKKYPFSWQEYCNPQSVTPPKIEPVPIKQNINRSVPDKSNRPINIPDVKPMPTIVVSTVNTPKTPLESHLIKKIKPKPRLKPKKLKLFDEIEQVVLGVALKKYKEPVKGEAPVISHQYPQAILMPALPYHCLQRMA